MISFGRRVRFARFPLLASIGLLAASGCSGYKPNAGGDALIGTWFAQITPPSTDNQTETVTFSSNGTFTSVHSQFDTQPNPGCTEKQVDTGTFTDDGKTLTTTTDVSASGKITLTGCMNASDNGTSSSDPLWTSGSLSYTVTETTLSLLGAASTTFTRQ
jgi:hypothetical protein